MKNYIKNYFESEVSKVTPPPFPSFKKKKTIKPWENILLTALAVASLVIVYLPSSYESQIRSLVISEDAGTDLVDNLSRVVYLADLYFNNKRSQK